jgi:hypothetical protein
MTLIHCSYKDCINNEAGKCHAAAIKLDKNDCCLSYRTLESEGKAKIIHKGDRLLWDREYFEDDPIDDENAY